MNAKLFLIAVPLLLLGCEQRENYDRPAAPANTNTNRAPAAAPANRGLNVPAVPSQQLDLRITPPRSKRPDVSRLASAPFTLEATRL